MAGIRTLGFVGIGRMGTPMARRLLEHGYELIVHDVDPRAVKKLVTAGARAARSAQDLAARAPVVLASLPTPQIVREVALGAHGLAAGRAMRLFVDLSTTGAEVESEVATALQRRGVRCVDAPVSGGIGGAVKGTLAVMAAGAPAAVAAARPLLEVLGKVFVVGERPGQAQIMKLCNNLLGANALAASAEVFALGVKAGLDADTMVAVINAGSGRNSATLDKFPKSVLTRRFDWGFSIDGYCKDIGLGIAEADRLGCTMWVTNAVKHLFDFARSQGAGAQDLTTIVNTVERWAGVEVRGKAARKARRGGK